MNDLSFNCDIHMERTRTIINFLLRNDMTSVADLKLLVSDPYPTWRGMTDPNHSWRVIPNPDPTCQVISDQGPELFMSRLVSLSLHFSSKRPDAQ